MPLALMSDIHGNREAFEACLADAASQNVARYVLLGDFVGYGADPVFAVERAADLVARGAVAVMGNHDRAALAPDDRMNADAAAAIAWTRERLTGAQREFLAGLPLAVEEDERLYVHAEAWAPAAWGYVTDRLAAERSLAATQCRVTFCGHVHVPAVFSQTGRGPADHVVPATGIGIPLRPDRRWLAVIGSVGQPRDGDPAASYALYDEAAGTLTYRRVSYDVATAAAKIRRAGLPERLAARLERGR